MKFLIKLIFIFFFFHNSFAWAEETLTMNDALSIAYTSNPQMIEARMAVEGAKGDLITARTLDSPSLEADIGGLKKNEDGVRKGHLDSIQITQDFDLPGLLGVNNRIAKDQLKVEEESVKSMWSEVYFEVRTVYTKIILDKKKVEAGKKNTEIMRQFFSQVQLRYQNGQALKNDLQRAKIELLNTENVELVASKDLKEDKARLNILLGRSMEHEFNIQEDLREDELKLNFKELKETALAHDPDFKMEKLLLNIKKRNLTKEKLNRLPTFSLGFQKTNQDFEKDYSALISINIPFWNLNHGEVKKATAEKISQEAKVKSQETETVFDVYQAYLNAELARKQMELFRESLDESKELFVLAGLRYNEGKIDFLNYLDQVRTVREAQTNYYEGLFNLNESISELEKAVYASLRKEEYFDEKF